MGDKDIRLPRSETEFTFAAVSLLRALETGTDCSRSNSKYALRDDSYAITNANLDGEKVSSLSPPMDLSSLSS